jgi:protein-L-isoaspartate O-methyltransferase
VTADPAPDRDVLRRTFDAEAERYDRARPRYPAELVADLAGLAALGPGSRVLEVAPGTGQLTVPLAALGCAVTAVELGPALAAVARRNLAPYPGAEVVVCAFEDWPLPAEPFDAVVCATALHWFDPVTWVAKVVAALRPGGAVATVATHHVAGGTREFFQESQACYQRWEGVPPGFRMPTAAEVPRSSRDLDQSGRLTPVTFRRYERELEYSTAAYLDTQRTYSNILALPEAAREGLLGCLGDLIDSSYQGRIVKRYLFELRVAHEMSLRETRRAGGDSADGPGPAVADGERDPLL